MKKKPQKPKRTVVSLPLSVEELTFLDAKVAATEMTRVQYIRHVMRETGHLPARATQDA